ncbi:MAG: DUF4115 domain-containing protein [Magnetococcales bacterium]|nr:DUF4115 domain-containing protein [Magnetococcales bacterium]
MSTKPIQLPATGKSARPEESGKTAPPGAMDKATPPEGAGKTTPPVATDKATHPEGAGKSTPPMATDKATPPGSASTLVITEWSIAKPVVTEQNIPSAPPLLDKPAAPPGKPAGQESNPATSREKEKGRSELPRSISERYQEKVSGAADWQPESEQAVSLLADEMVWVQIQDETGKVVKDMVMQPHHLFRVPPGERFVATLGNAGAVRLRVGKRELPHLGSAGEELNGVELTADALLRRAKP